MLPSDPSVVHLPALPKKTHVLTSSYTCHGVHGAHFENFVRKHYKLLRMAHIKKNKTKLPLRIFLVVKIIPASNMFVTYFNEFTSVHHKTIRKITNKT